MLEHIIDLPSSHTNTHAARPRKNGTTSHRASHNYCIMNKRRNERMKKRREPIRGRLNAWRLRAPFGVCGCYRVCCATHCIFRAIEPSRFTSRIYFFFFSCFLRQFNLALGGLEYVNFNENRQANAIKSAKHENLFIFHYSIGNE